MIPTTAESAEVDDIPSPFSDDMNDILAPSMEDGVDEGNLDPDNENSQERDSSMTEDQDLTPSSTAVSNTFSLDDSIINRVEMEIEAAKQRAEEARGKNRADELRDILLSSTLSAEDMDSILQTVSTSSTDARTPRSTSSFENVMSMIDDEFKSSPPHSKGSLTRELFAHEEEAGDELDIDCPADSIPNDQNTSDAGSEGELSSAHADDKVEMCMSEDSIELTSTQRQRTSTIEEEKKNEDDVVVESPVVGDGAALWSGEIEVSSGEDGPSSESKNVASIVDNSLDEHGHEERFTQTSPASPESQTDDVAELPNETSEDFEMSLEESLSRVRRHRTGDAIEAFPELATENATDVDVSFEHGLSNIGDKSKGMTPPSEGHVEPEEGSEEEQGSENQQTSVEEVEPPLNNELTSSSTVGDADTQPKMGTDALGTDQHESVEQLPSATNSDTKEVVVEPIAHTDSTGTLLQRSRTSSRSGPLITGVPKPRGPPPSLQMKTSNSGRHRNNNSLLVAPNRMKKSPSNKGSMRDTRQALSSASRKEHGQDAPEEDEEALKKTSRRLRFRKSFPILKPAPGPRSNGEIIETHTLDFNIPPISWMKPKKELRQLIVAAMGTSLQRRSNACGALKVLTAQKKNQLSLVRTDSFLTALVFTASQSVLPTDQELSIAARTRAVTCLRNVSLAKENRVHVFQQPGLAECLLKVIDEDNGEGRVLACATFALLAKSPECRVGLARTVGVVDSLSRLLANPEAPARPSEDKTDDSSKPDDETCSDYESKSSFSQSHADRDDYDDDYSASSRSSDDSEDEEGSDRERDTQEIRRTESYRSVQNQMQAEYHQDSRSNACAVLVHLSRSCTVSPDLALNEFLIPTCVKVAKEVVNPIHCKCIEILRNLTLFPGNNALLSNTESVVNTLVATAANSEYADNRLASLRALQNMSADAVSKAILAVPPVLNLLTSCAIRKDLLEKEAAVATLHNISTEPSTVVALMNTKNVIATLVHVAHHPDSTSHVRLLACEALATTSLWLQTLAGTGKCPDGVPNVMLPSQKTYGWERWD